MEAAQERPPYVTFELVAVEDRSATIANGHYASKDVVYAYITPQGSKDRVPRIADEWLTYLEDQVAQGRFDPRWLERYRAQHQAFLDGIEAPLEGTSVANWPSASPSQVKLLQAANLRTVEDLANANEEALSRIGMGGRALKAKAIEWLTAAKDTGRLAEEISALKVQNEELSATNKELMGQIRELSLKFDQLSSARTATKL